MGCCGYPNGNLCLRIIVGINMLELIKKALVLAVIGVTTGGACIITASMFFPEWGVSFRVAELTFLIVIFATAGVIAGSFREVKKDVFGSPINVGVAAGSVYAGIQLYPFVF